MTLRPLRDWWAELGIRESLIDIAAVAVFLPIACIGFSVFLLLYAAHVAWMRLEGEVEEML